MERVKVPSDKPLPWLAVGSFFGLTAVALGALAAHGLKSHLDEGALATFEVGVRYQMYHAFALLVAGWLASQRPSPIATASAFLFTAGIVLFSGSLYGLVLVGWKWLGPVTPIGGGALMAGWTCLGIVAFRRST